MFSKRILLITTVSCLICACTYHGRMRRGIYTQPNQAARLKNSILIVTDKSITPQISIIEPGSAATRAFTLDTADGVAVAATDALGTLFEYADAGPKSLQNQYDFVAQVVYKSKLTRADCEEGTSAWEIRTDGLCTRLEINIRRPQETEPLVHLSAKRWNEFLQPGFPAGVKWLNEHTASIFFPILDPLYVQTQGMRLRKQAERQLKESLEEMMEELTQHPEIFSSPNSLPLANP